MRRKGKGKGFSSDTNDLVYPQTSPTPAPAQQQQPVQAWIPPAQQGVVQGMVQQQQGTAHVPPKNTPAPYPVFALQDRLSGQEEHAFEGKGKGKRKRKSGRWRRRKKQKGKGSSHYTEGDFYIDELEEYFDPLIMEEDGLLRLEPIPSLEMLWQRHVKMGKNSSGYLKKVSKNKLQDRTCLSLLK